MHSKLIVNAGLPEPLRQGLFTTPAKEYDVIIRLSQTPGELPDDRKVSTPRGFAIKVLDVSGEKLDAFPGNTQDFVLANGKVFITPGAESFLQAFKPNAEVAPHLSDPTKGIVSDISRNEQRVNSSRTHVG